jgi:hypothetical protein
MTDRRTIRLVIYLIGAVTVLSLIGTYLLAQRVLDQAAGAKTPDAAVVGLVGTLGAIVTGGLGYLGGVLASTRSTPDKAEIEEALAPLAAAGAGIPVTGPGGGPVETVETPPADPPRSRRGG